VIDHPKLPFLRKLLSLTNNFPSPSDDFAKIIFLEHNIIP
jgi:hypothetical protein